MVLGCNLLVLLVYRNQVPNVWVSWVEVNYLFTKDVLIECQVCNRFLLSDILLMIS